MGMVFPGRSRVPGGSEAALAAGNFVEELNQIRQAAARWMG